MTQLTGPKKEAWARHLREADRLAKQKLWERAIRELEQALAIDPKDMYARSYLERVRAQWTRQQEVRKSAEEEIQSSLDQRMELIPKLLSASEQFIEQGDYQAALKEIAKVYKIDPNNYYARAHSDRIEELMRERQDQQGGQAGEVRQGPARTDETGDVIFYKELLREYWFDGKLTAEEEEHLVSVRSSFGITDKDHDRLSKDVKLEAYMEALRIAWIDGVISEHERKTLDFMRNKYGISPQESVAVEKKVQALRKDKPERARIVIADSDREHALAMTRLLKKYGYNTMLTSSGPGAVKLLAHVVPKAIVIAMTYEDKEMDGFEVYRLIRLLPALRHVPVFLTLHTNDKDIIHTAIRLGIDHVLQRPVDAEFIAAAVRGREVRQELQAV